MSITYYVNYRDDGPSGPGVQNMERISAWNQLLIFPDRASYVAWARDGLEDMRTHRKNARIDSVWEDDPDLRGMMGRWGDVVHMRGQEGEGANDGC